MMLFKRLINGDRPESEKWGIYRDGLGQYGVWDRQNVKRGPVFEGSLRECKEFVREAVQELLYKHADNSGDVIDEQG